MRFGVMGPLDTRRYATYTIGCGCFRILCEGQAYVNREDRIWHEDEAWIGYLQDYPD